MANCTTQASDEENGLAFLCWRRCLSLLLPSHCAVQGKTVDEMWMRYIFDRYTEPQRYYHTMAHVEEMLNYFLQYQKGTRPDHRLPEDGARCLALELAVLFHDVVYDPKRGDNEECSADWFSAFWEECRELAVSWETKMTSEDDRLQQQQKEKLIWHNAKAAMDIKMTVVDFILRTKHHMSVEPCYRRDLPGGGEGALETGNSPPDLHLFLDLDLAILGSEADRYMRYASDVRREYAWYSDEEFSRGRIAFLQGFLNYPQWYKTKYFCDAMEETARANVTAELKLLEERLGRTA